ncbi:hypothetical protein [Crassaminicella indica]|uniref:FbpB family small basic protein n=1 Tax=Crassaminicella indica TaxID=2855394 RepID=A0ABX8RFL7_9CLOT|nr:hypothetical protein [Crassaminicella indica]QXM07209.1 hypothetical protein KVH43_05830 [Crassaminicella indica]
MDYVKRLMEKRELLMDKYIMFIQKNNLSEDEIKDKKRINRELIHIDFEIEKAKKEAKMS